MLSYAGAIKILHGELDLGSLDLAAAMAEMVRLGGQLTLTPDAVRGRGRHNRTQGLIASHVVLVVTAFCEAAAELVRPGRAGLLDDLATSPVPVPSADRSHAVLRADVLAWSRDRADHLGELVDGQGEALRRLPDRAVELYDAAFRRLAGEIPEFAIWAGDAEPGTTARGLERLESMLLRATSGSDPSLHHAALALAYRAELGRPVLRGEAGDLVLPTLADAYIDPHFRVKAAGPDARPSAENWWDTPVRRDLPTFLAAYLTTGQATETPMLLLGQPGAGKSSLTRILAARLPASDFFVARVPLREVPAEAGVQEQVEHALRVAIGETVAWAALAREAGDALPVILLDGFDELLQATGLHQSDYLRRVAEFQRRESGLGRPVAVVVTSRLAVADWAKLPDGGLAVRLEPFDDEQIARWTGVWNEANGAGLARAGLDPLRPEVLTRFRELAAQPLLLLMLALYDANGNPLRDDAAAFGTSQLYERLLGQFAAREVERVYAGVPDQQARELVEAELVRLSVVAFAMFNRNRLWVSERELDADLAGLNLSVSRVAETGGFRTPLTAGEEMVGRFFFIQRAQALRDDKILQTYEFLHATFGEYLIARLLVRVVRELAAREAVVTVALRLGQESENDLLRSLLGYTPLTVRNTVLSFVSGLLTDSERPTIRAALLRRARDAMIRPTWTPSRYQPVDNRIDHWMAIYSFNVVLLVLACGGELRATEVWQYAADPADWLRNSALQWRAAIPGGMWLESLEHLAVRRDRHGGRRDIVISLADGSTVEPIDADWSNRVDQEESPRPEYTSNFRLEPVLKSMHLSNNLSDDTLLHALEPLIERMPEAISTFVRGPSGATSVARALIQVWVTSALGDPEALAGAYVAAARAVGRRTEWGEDIRPGTAALFHSLRTDAPRLPGHVLTDVVRLIMDGHSADYAPLSIVLECLLAKEDEVDAGVVAEVVEYIHGEFGDDITRARAVRLILGAATIPDLLKAAVVNRAYPEILFLRPASEATAGVSPELDRLRNLDPGLARSVESLVDALRGTDVVTQIRREQATETTSWGLEELA